MDHLASAEVTLIRIACEVLHDLGEERFPEDFFALPPDILSERLSAAYRGESLSDVLQCRAVVDRAMVPVN